MLTTEERKKAIDYIVTKAAALGKKAFDNNLVQVYDVALPHCTVTATIRPDCFGTSVDIAENYGDARYADQGPREFAGIRTIYSGKSEGLEAVSLQGIQRPNADGTVLPMAERALRFKGSTDGRHLTAQDQERYDAFLSYARREL